MFDERVFRLFSFFFSCVFQVCFPLVHSSGLSISLSRTRGFFFFGCVFQFFFKELWICRWWAAPVLEAGPPRGRAGTRGRPTAAERISVFKAFENKLLQFPGCRVGAGRGVPGHGFP